MPPRLAAVANPDAFTTPGTTQVGHPLPSRYGAQLRLTDADEAETAKAASRQRLSDVKSFLGRDRVHVNSGCRTRRHCVDGWSLTSGNEVEALGNRTQHSS